MKPHLKFTTKKTKSLIIFSVWLWGLLYLWLILMHYVEEKVGETLLASPFIYIALIASMVLFIMQKKSGCVEGIGYRNSVFGGYVSTPHFNFQHTPDEDP